MKVKIKKDDVIIVADYKNLYGTIENTYGIKAIKTFLNKLAKEPSPLIPEDQINFICDLLHWTLNNNYIQFEQIIYKQIHGTATGIPGSVVYADFVLVILEQPCILEFGDIITLFKRYIDDIFAIANKDCNIIQLIQKQNKDIQLDEKSVTIGDTGIFLDIKATL